MDFGWVTIHVRDMKESLQFYQEIISLKISRKMKPGPDREIVFLETGKTEIELIHDGGDTSYSAVSNPAAKRGFSSKVRCALRAASLAPASPP